MAVAVAVAITGLLGQHLRNLSGNSVCPGNSRNVKERGRQNLGKGLCRIQILVEWGDALLMGWLHGRGPGDGTVASVRNWILPLAKCVPKRDCNHPSSSGPG
jgi:hypothetical protein